MVAVRIRQEQGSTAVAEFQTAGRWATCARRS